ncbi:MAG: presqualene diphosphate synthase HpnD [Frankiaceae bacterium]
MTVTGSTPAVAVAYAECERITRSEARNFSYGIRLLPADKRAALSAVYAFSRRIDDIGDGDLNDDEKLQLLAAARTDLTHLGDRPDDPVLVALADAAHRFPLPLGAFEELIEGVELDVRGATCTTAEDLVHYCRCVAGSIGRLSLGVFTAPDPAVATPLADTLGLALQLTNILRDVREDTATGRSYLPKEDLAAHGVDLRLDDDGRLVGSPALDELIRFEAARAQAWYAEGIALLDLLDRRSRACCAAMAGIYHRVLRRIAADPAAVRDGRVALPTAQKLAVAARALAGWSV